MTQTLSVEDGAIIQTYAPPEVAFELPMDFERRAPQYKSEVPRDDIILPSMRMKLGEDFDIPVLSDDYELPEDLEHEAEYTFQEPTRTTQTEYIGSPVSDVEFAVPVASRFKSRSPVRENGKKVIEASNRKTQVAYIDVAPHVSKAGVRGMVTIVAHGTFESRPATLIVFAFSLRSGEGVFRFQSAHIKITFGKLPQPSNVKRSSGGSEPQEDNTNGPVVVKFAPRKIYGLPTKEHRGRRVGGDISLQVPAGPVTAGPKLSGDLDWHYEKNFRYKIIGNFWSSKRGADWDLVYWDMTENKKTHDGIPDLLHVAVVVDRGGRDAVADEAGEASTVNDGAGTAAAIRTKDEVKKAETGAADTAAADETKDEVGKGGKATGLAGFTVNDKTGAAAADETKGEVKKGRKAGGKAGAAAGLAGFTASVEVSVQTPLINSDIFAFPWTKNRPAAFSSKVQMGPKPRTTEFDKLTEADWRGLVPYEGEWEDKLTEGA